MVSIIIPIYNEALTVESVINDIIHQMDSAERVYEIIAVDDGSRDDSLARIKTFSGIRILRHENNRGVGAARNTGINAANGRIIVMIDADGTYPAEAIPAMLEKMEDLDMVIGQRDKEVLFPRTLRWGLKVVLNRSVSFILKRDIKDINSGLRAFKKSLIGPFLNIMPHTHSWMSTSTIVFSRNGYSVGYLPIDYYKRAGKSSFNLLSDGLRTLLCVAKALFLRRYKIS